MTRLFSTRRLCAVLLHRRRRRSFVAGLLAGLFVPRLLGLGLELVDAPLLLRERRGLRRVLVARTISAAVPSIPIAVTTAAVAPSAAMLFALALGARRMALAFGRKLMDRGCLATGHRRLLVPRLLPLLRRALLLSALISPLISAIGARPALISPVGTPILALPLTIALLGLAVTATTLLEPAMLLAVAAAAIAAIATLVAASIAALVAIATLLLVAAMVALVLLRLRLNRRWSGRRCRRRSRGEEGSEQTRQESACRRRCGLCHWLWRRGGLRGARLPYARGVIDDRRRLRRRDALHDRLLALQFRLGGLGARHLRFLRLLDQLVARGHMLHLVQLVVPQALHLVVRRVEVLVRDQHDVDLQARLELLDLGALLVQEE